jgi:hypothetical protein
MPLAMLYRNIDFRMVFIAYRHGLFGTFQSSVKKLRSQPFDQKVKNRSHVGEVALT